MYKLFTDGGSRGNPGKAACAAVLYNTTNEIFNTTGVYLGIKTNNEAEYYGLINGLQLALANNIFELECFLDSELIVKQLKGEYKVKMENLIPLYQNVLTLKAQFKKISFTHVKRELNKQADKLVNQVLDAN